jgi:hypothetical protein
VHGSWYIAATSVDSHHPTIPMRWILLLLLALAGGHAAMAQQSVAIPSDITVAQLARVTVPITGTLDVPPGATVDIDFTFVPSVVQPGPSTGGPTAAFRCASVDVTNVVVTSRTEGSFTLRCSDVQSVTSGLIAQLDLTGLPSQDDQGALAPVRLRINGEERTGVTFSGGIVRISGDRARPTLAEGIASNFPNPFSNASTFTYTMATDGPVTFTIRDIKGAVYATLPKIEQSRGTHQLEFSVESWQLASGTYIMQMTTETDAYLHPFVVVK